jgi:hypothetical protein
MGEFGVASDGTSLKGLDNMLSYMDKNSDVWIGATYWAGGSWWGDYMYSLEPKNGADKPQMAILQKYNLGSGGTPDKVAAPVAEDSSFVFDNLSKVATISNFTVGVDQIEFDQSVFKGLPYKGTLAEWRFYEGTDAHDSTDRIIYDSKSGSLYYDSDGTGSAAAIKVAQLNKGLALSNTDFLVF